MEYDKRMEIGRLLDAYFDGETTLEQERRLREYFMSEDVPSDLLYVKAMFTGFADAAAEGYAGRPELGPKEDRTCGGDSRTDAGTAKTSSPKKGRLRAIYTTLSVAASLMIAVGVTWILVYDSKPTVYCYVNGHPVTDIDVAARQTQMVTRLIEGSARVSADGIARVAEASRPMEKLGSTLRMLGMTGYTEE